jgi:hypothetical protein
LQQGYQDYATSMAQTMSSAEADYNNNVNTWKNMTDKATEIYNLEQGVDQKALDYVKSRYDYYAQMATDTEAANTDSKGGQKHAWDTFWASYDWGDIA